MEDSENQLSETENAGMNRQTKDFQTHLDKK